MNAAKFDVPVRRHGYQAKKLPVVLALVVLAAAVGAHAQQAPSPASPMAPVVGPPPADPKGAAVVPPLVRKTPPPAKTSVPIVAPPSRKAAKALTPAAAKAPPKAKSAPASKAVKGKAPTPPQKSSLGAKGTPVPACAKGFAYEATQLRCVKTSTSPQKASR